MPTYTEDLHAALNDLLHEANQFTPAVASKDLNLISDCFCTLWQKFNLVSWVGHDHINDPHPDD